MELFNRFNVTNAQVVKATGITFLGLVALYVLSTLFTSSFGLNSARMAPMGTQLNNPIGGGYGMYADEAVSLSARNVSGTMEPPTNPTYTDGDTSEEYEIKQYSATIETRNREKDCDTIRSLKARTDVIFENANEYSRGCSYTFKVKKESVEDVLGVIKGLDPKELTEQSYTIKQEVQDYSNEIQILQNKLASLDKTLADAVMSYENITTLATSAGNVDSLAKIIESKLTIIERLTSARIETSNQLDRMNRSKAEALDRLLYTYFTVQVFENTFIQWDDIENSWKGAVQQFVRQTNESLQDISIGLVSFMLLVIKLGLYFVIGLLAVRFGWRFAKRVWNSGDGV